MECPNCDTTMELLKREYVCPKCGYKEKSDDRMYPNPRRKV